MALIGGPARDLLTGGDAPVLRKFDPLSATMHTAPLPPPPPPPPCAILRSYSRYAPCLHNVTYGCTPTRVWVKKGCRGVFSCGSVPTSCGDVMAHSTECACGDPSLADANEMAALSNRSQGDANVSYTRGHVNTPMVELIHIPKTAGSSLRASLNSFLGANLDQFGWSIIAGSVISPTKVAAQGSHSIP